MSPLFERDALDNGTGILSDRWGQEGSVVINLAEDNVTSNTNLYTVPDQKVLYVTDIYIQQALAAPVGTEKGKFEDIKNAATVDMLYCDVGNFSTGQIQQYTFKTPLQFDYYVLWTETGGNPGVRITISGWIEDA